MVTLRRKDGGTVNASPSVFSEQDRDYIFDNLEILYSMSDFKMSTAQIKFFWKIDSTFDSQVTFQYYEHDDKSAMSNKEGGWAFYADVGESMVISHMRPISIKMRTGSDPFGASPSDPLASKTGVSKGNSSSPSQYLLDMLDQLKAKIIETKLTSIDGMLCRYYKIDDVFTIHEIWSIPKPDTPYHYLLSSTFKDLNYFPEFMYSESLRKREGRKLQNGTIRTEKPIYLSSLNRHIAILDECPILIRSMQKGNSDPKKLHSLETVMRVSSISGSHHASGQAAIDGVLRNMDKSVIQQFLE